VIRLSAGSLSQNKSFARFLLSLLLFFWREAARKIDMIALLCFRAGGARSMKVGHGV
jgi:hypothetical protein